MSDKTWEVERDPETLQWVMHRVVHGVRIRESAVVVDRDRGVLVSVCLCKVRHLIPISALIELLQAAGVLQARQVEEVPCETSSTK